MGGVWQHGAAQCHQCHFQLESASTWNNGAALQNPGEKHAMQALDLPCKIICWTLILVYFPRWLGGDRIAILQRNWRN